MMTNRTNRGSAIAEIGPVLWVTFILIVFPMINLATSTVRAYFAREAILEGVHRASKAPSYEQDVVDTDEDGNAKPPQLSAKNAFEAFITEWKKRGFNGITIDQPATIKIVREDPATNTSQEFNRPLNPNEVDRNKYIYFVEVSTTGTAQPLVPMPFPFFNFPGLFQPMPLQLAGKEMFEDVDGLTR